MQVPLALPRASALGTTAVMANELGQALRRARKMRTATLVQVAHAAGVSYAAVQQWEKGTTRPETENLFKAAAFLRIDATAAMRGEVVDVGEPAAQRRIAEAERNVAPALNAPPPATLARGERDVPVFGVAVGGSAGDFTFNGQTIEYVPRPLGLTTVASLYALYVTNDSMVPRYEHGDLVYVNPNRPPAIGDDVVIELHGEGEGEPGPGYIKRLKSRSPARIVVEQFNPPEDIVLDPREVKALHRVVPWREAIGF